MPSHGKRACALAALLLVGPLEHRRRVQVETEQGVSTCAKLGHSELSSAVWNELRWATLPLRGPFSFPYPL